MAATQEKVRSALRMKIMESGSVPLQGSIYEVEK